MASQGSVVTKQTGLSVRVRGLVQGVGFRPTVLRLANECGLTGNVLNDGSGVLIHVWGTERDLAEFKNRLATEAPPLSQIDSIETSSLDETIEPPSNFQIVQSISNRSRTGIVPDAATCPDCLAEVFDAGNRRHRYPFTNCTHCGPRLSIISAIPYDRKNTSMASFEMCASCQREYTDPEDRRFHAQPNACSECGPRVWLHDRAGKPLSPGSSHDVLRAAARAISEGSIVAIKGIGGFHLACDATNNDAVTELRRRKQRYDKPFALMARNVAALADFVHVSASERNALESRQAPIVVLEKRDDAPPLAEALAPGHDSLGFMLPYTPLHALLMRELDAPVVLTSGNRSDEPQVIDNNEAEQRLADIADFWLMHDRAIINRLDDSVVRTMGGAPRLLRRARGYAPAPLLLPPGFETASDILAMGAELKNTFCLIKDGQAILSQHIGDLEDAAANSDYRNNLALYRDLFEFNPQTIAIDMHTDYLSTQWGAKLASNENTQIEQIQHHHAHIAACLAENAVPLTTGKVLGIALDGLGLGDDGTLWGGEFLAADYVGFERLAYFAPTPLPGGAKAMREPWRNCYAQLKTHLDWEEVCKQYAYLPLIKYLCSKPLPQLDVMLERGLNAPPATSAGRLFDALAAAIGVCRDRVSYEGQAAIELETLAAKKLHQAKAYSFDLDGEGQHVLRFAGMWHGVLMDLASGIDVGAIAARFHKTIIDAVVATATDLAATHRLDTVALSGGVFQNKLLFEGVVDGLKASGISTILTHRQVPANDGGISLGQAVVCAARMLKL